MKKVFLIIFIIPVILSSCEIFPEAYFFTDKVQVYIGEEIYFTNESYNAVDYEWDFGDGTFSNAVHPIHSYSASGTYEVMLTAYSKTGASDRAYQTITVVSPTILEVEVLEWNDEYPVAGANVRLYPTLDDWDNETNMVDGGNTNVNGKVIFYNLGPFVYYVDVWEDHHNNWDLRGYMDDIYIRTDQLVPNEVNTFIAWVDYVGKKGGTKRDRTMVVRKIDRKPKK
ncbi:MAG: PKD domain-containing protein [Bacteroidota bacterium]|nr:PKD domain-containing protein [Bacteroidota bacterium]